MAEINYRPELDGIRAICIILTMANHVPGGPSFINGSIGVDVFFALSGWLITILLTREFSRNLCIDLRSFYIRRFFRIVPLYFCAVAAYGIAAWCIFFLGRGDEDVRSYSAALPWLVSFNSEYRGIDAGNIFGHAWTLGIEEKFYIIWPLFVASILSKKLRYVALLPVLAFIFIWLGHDRSYLLRGYVGLSAGAILAICSENRRIKNFLSNNFSVSAFLLIIISFYVFSVFFPVKTIWNVAISISAAFFIGGLWFNNKLFISRFLSFSPLAFLGKLTFAIYLFHVLVINVVLLICQKSNISLSYLTLFFCAYGLSIICAAFLHYGVEKPLIGVGRKLSQPTRLASLR